MSASVNVLDKYGCYSLRHTAYGIQHTQYNTICIHVLWIWTMENGKSTCVFQFLQDKHFSVNRFTFVMVVLFILYIKYTHLYVCLVKLRLISVSLT